MYHPPSRCWSKILKLSLLILILIVPPSSLLEFRSWHALVCLNSGTRGVKAKRLEMKVWGHGLGDFRPPPPHARSVSFVFFWIPTLPPSLPSKRHGNQKGGGERRGGIWIIEAVLKIGKQGDVWRKKKNYLRETLCKSPMAFSLAVALVAESGWIFEILDSFGDPFSFHVRPDRMYKNCFHPQFPGGLMRMTSFS